MGLCAPLFAAGLLYAQFTHLEQKLEPWGPDSASHGVTAVRRQSATWAIGAADGVLRSSADLANFSDRSRSLANAGKTIYELGADPTRWAILSDAGSGTRQIKTTTNFSVYSTISFAVVSNKSFTPYTMKYSAFWVIGGKYTDIFAGGPCDPSVCKYTGIKITTDFASFSSKVISGGSESVDEIITSVDTDGSQWAFGDKLGNLTTTADFTNYTTRTGHGLSLFDIVKGGSSLWAVHGKDGFSKYVLKTTTDFASWSDRTSQLGWEGGSTQVLKVIQPQGTYWFLGGTGGKAKATVDFVVYSDLSSAIGVGNRDVLSAEKDGGQWLIGAANGVMRQTGAFRFFSNRNSQMGSPTANLQSVGVNPAGTLWAVGGGDGSTQTVLRTTQDFVNWSDRASLLQPSIWGYQVQSIATDGTTWGLFCCGGVSPGFFRTTTDFVNFSNRDGQAGIGGNSINWVVATNGSLWVLGGSSNTSVPYVKTTTDLVTYSDMSSELDWGSSSGVTTLAESGGVWAIGGALGKLKTTTNFVNFSDRSSALGISSSLVVWGIASAKGVWAVGGGLSGTSFLKTTTNFINFSDRSSALNFGTVVRTVQTDGELWTIGGNQGRFKSTLDFLTYSDLSSALNWGTAQILDHKTRFGIWLLAGAGGRVRSTAFHTHYSDWSRRGSVGGAVNSVAVTSDGATWAIGGNDGELRTTANYTNFSDRTAQIAFSANITSIDTKGGTWVIVGDGGSLKVTSDFVTYSTYAGYPALAMVVGSMAGSPVTWWFGAGQGKIWQTTDFITFDDITSYVALHPDEKLTAIRSDDDKKFVFGGYEGSVFWCQERVETCTDVTYPVKDAGMTTVRAIETDGTTWALVGNTFLTTTDFSTFTDRGNTCGQTLTSIRRNGDGVWAVGASGASLGCFKTTMDFVNFTDRSTALDFQHPNTAVTSIAAPTTGSSKSTFLVGGGDLHRLATNATTPLAVTLSRFEALAYDGEVWVYWQTASEVYNVGFNLYRATAGQEAWTLLTPQPITGLGTTMTGGKYLYRDFGVANGETYYYYLEDIDYFKGGTLHGPVSARPSGERGKPRELTAREQGEYAAIVLSTQVEAVPAAPGEGSPGGIGGSSPATSVRAGARESVIEVTIPAGALASTEAGPEFSIPGMSPLALPGKPVVPYRGLLVEVPCRHKQEVRVSVGREEVVEGEVRLAPAADVRDATGALVQAGLLPPDSLGASDDPYVETETYPASYATVGEVRCYGAERGHLTVGLTPARYSAAAGRIFQARELEIGITWGEAFDPEEREVSAVTEALAADGESLKVGVRRSGIYRIAAGDLEPFWPSVALYRRAFVRLYRDGQAVPFQWVGSSEGAVGSDGELEFYAEQKDTRYSNESIYWLAYRSDGPLPSAARSPRGVPESRVALVETTRAESNFWYHAGIPGSRDVDRFFWDYASYNPPTRSDRPARVSFALPALETGSVSSATVRVALQTATEDAAIEPRQPSHHLRLYLNGALLDDFTVAGMASLVRSADLPVSWLRVGDNQLELREVGDRSSRFVRTNLNWIEVRAERTPVWPGTGELSVEAAATGTAELEGLPASAAVSIWDRTDPTAPSKYPSAESDDTGGLRFPVQGGRLYALRIAPQGVSRIWKNGPSRLKTLPATPTVYITHAEFREAAERLAAYRSQFRAVTVVDVEDIYDHYSGGRKSIEAITAFLGDWKSRHGGTISVLLIGDASSDPNGYLAARLGRPGAVDYVPTDLVFRLYVETGSDPSLVHGIWDWHVSDRIGRLPVTAAAEAETIVDKIIEFESTPAQAEWAKKISLFADWPKADWENAFRTFTQELAASIGEPYAVDVGLQPGEKVVAELRAQIQEAFNAGTLLVNYLGHGAYNFWGRDWVFKSADLTALTNAERPAVVTALNCLNGYFVNEPADAASRSLAEMALAHSSGAAVAYISSSGTNMLGPLELFGAELYRELTQKRPETLGEAVAAVLARLPDVPYVPELSDTMHLFGDPDLRIPGNEKPRALVPDRSGSGESGERRRGAASDRSGEVDLKVPESGTTKIDLGAPPSEAGWSDKALPFMCGAAPGGSLLLLPLLGWLLLRRRREAAMGRAPRS